MPVQSTILCGIYTITNSTNGKVYVGSGRYIKRRWTNHRRDLRNSRHSNPHLQRAWDRDGESAFVFALVEEVADAALLIEREQHWLDATRCYDPECGYNISPSAYSILGYRFTDEQKARVAAAIRGKPKSAEHRAHIWANREVTDEHRANMSRLGQSGRGKPKPQVSAAQSGEKNNQAKLTASQVSCIKQRLANGERARSLADEYGMGRSTIFRIRNGETWKHVK